MSTNKKVEIKAALVLAFMGLGATLAGAGCLAGAVRSTVSLIKGEID